MSDTGKRPPSPKTVVLTPSGPSTLVLPPTAASPSVTLGPDPAAPARPSLPFQAPKRGDARVRPIPIVALRPAASGTVVWRRGGTLFVTVFVKATFELLHEQPARMVPAMPIAAGTAETAPFLPSAGVTLTGRAHAPGGRPVEASSARLAVLQGGRPVLDKLIRVVASGPFANMPLVHERAFGCAENPAGTATPNLMDPSDPRRPACFAPIPKAWPVRRRLLGSIDPARLEASIAEIPDGFDGSWFHDAPADQRIPFLQGDEILVLDGMRPSHPRLEGRLPGARGKARRYTALPDGTTREEALDLVADVVTIDAERALCSVTWRQSFSLPDLDALERTRLVAGVEVASYDGAASGPMPRALSGPGKPLAWPEADAKSRASTGTKSLSPAEAAAAVRARVAPFAVAPAETRSLSPAEAAAAVHARLAPFPLATPGAAASAPSAPIPGAPWSASSAEPEAVAEEPELEVVTEEPAAAPPPEPQTVAAPEPDATPAPPPAPPAPKARDELVARLRAGAPLHGLDLEGADLRGLDLRGADLAGLRLAGADLGGCDLTGARLADAQLAGADLTKATLVNADLSRADLAGAKLAGARLDGADLSRASCPRAVLAGAGLVGANLSRLSGDGADLAGASLDRADLRQARLAGASFEGATLTGLVAGKADLSGARLVRADLTGAVLRGAKLTGANLARATLDDADLRDADLDRANLFETARAAAKLAGARMNDTVEEDPDP